MSDVSAPNIDVLSIAEAELCVRSQDPGIFDILPGLKCAKTCSRDRPQMPKRQPYQTGTSAEYIDLYPSLERSQECCAEWARVEHLCTLNKRGCDYHVTLCGG